MESQLRAARPRTVFVTGGPGSGKGTQCAMMVKELNYAHTSIGDLMRNEIKQGTPEGKAAEAIVKSGNLVPKELTVDLLLKTLLTLKARTVLIDGFPRSSEQAVYLEQITTPIDFILHFDTDREDILVNRLIERGKSSGRADDKEETIVYRFQVYKSESAPVINLYDPFNIIRRVDCLAPINEVFNRAIKALRPEVFFIIGSLYSGKSSICNYLAVRYNLTWIPLDAIKSIKKKGKKPVVLTDDLEIVANVVSTLQNLREEYRVIIEGFPENINQAKHFARLIGEPNRVVYLRCSKDTAQQRLLHADKHSDAYMSPAVINNIYEKFSASIESITAHYKASLGKYYGEVLAEYSLDEVIRKVETLIIPEVILIKGHTHLLFLEYFTKLGYKLVNCVHLLELWRNARGLSSSTFQNDFSDDAELIPILRNVIFSGNGVCKFVIYNFALQSEELLKEFEDEVCSITISYYLCDSIPVLPDKPSHFLYSIGKLKPIYTSNLSEKSIKLQIQELEDYQKVWCVLILGPSQSGKTSIAKYLADQYNFAILDYNQVFEETKSFHSTEEDQRETVSYTEYLQGIARYLEKSTSKIVVIDGVPPNEILNGIDPKYPSFPPIPSEEEGYIIEEDINTEKKLQLIAHRLEDFFGKLRILMKIQLEAPFDVLQTRLKLKLETPPEENLTPEGVRELIETWRTYEKVSTEDQIIPNAIPRCLTFNTSLNTFPDVSRALKNSFQKKIILIRGYHIIDEIVSLFCWRNQLFYLDLSKVLYSAADRLDYLGEAVRKGPVDHKVKIALLKHAIENKGLRDKVIVIGGYENDPDLEYESSFEELVMFEQEIGEICILVNVQNTTEDVDIEPIPVRKRKDLSKANKTDESKADNPNDEDEEENTPKSPEKLDENLEDQPVPMWNHYMKSGFCKTFHNFKGKKAELLEVNLIRQGSMSLLLEYLQKGLEGNLKYNIQVVTDLVVEEILQNELGMLSFPRGYLLRQELSVDIRDLGNVTAKANKALTNVAASNFYKQAFIGLGASFLMFWEHFIPYLKAENWQPSRETRSAIKEAVDPHKSGFISVEELNSFFESWGNHEKKAEISIKSQSKVKKTSEFPDKSLILIVESSTPDPATKAKTFNRGDRIEISSDGYQKSPRNQKDGYVYFGKSNKRAKNDIEFSSADTRINFLHFLIRCKRKGYFLIDNGGKNGVKVRVVDNPVHLLKDFICKIGDHSFRVSHIQTPAARRDDSITSLFYKHYPPVPEGDGEITIEFISEELKGTVAKFGGDKKRIVLGSSRDSDVHLPGADAVHCIIELRSIGWCIIDQHSSTGSYVYVSTWDRYSVGAPSRQLHLTNLLTLSLPGTEFKLIVKQDLDHVLALSENPLLRIDRFRRLYRIGKYIKPGQDYKEFECTHKPSRDKCIVHVISASLKSVPVLEKLAKIKEIYTENMHKILEILEDGPYLYIIFEYLHGSDLQEIINLRTTMSELQVSLIFKNIISSLKVLHDNNFVHGNVRPENFVTTSNREDSSLKLVGLVRRCFNRESQHLEYLAPEGLQGKFSPASDVWAAGVILYTMLTGTHPFKGSADEETKAYIKRSNPSFKHNAWEGVSPYAKLLLKTIFVKDPKSRPSCGEILSNNWLNGRLKFVDLSVPLPAKSFKELKAYTCLSKQYSGLQLFINRLVASNQDKEEALKTFRELDTSMAEKLSRTEILSAFEYLHIELTEGELESIIREVDASMTGSVDYIEFLNAISNKRKNFNAEKLDSVFRNFENEATAFFNAAEIKALVGPGNLNEISKAVEDREDGKIEYKELKTLLLTIMPSL